MTQQHNGITRLFGTRDVHQTFDPHGEMSLQEWARLWIKVRELPLLRVLARSTTTTNFRGVLGVWRGSGAGSGGSGVGDDQVELKLLPLQEALFAELLVQEGTVPEFWGWQSDASTKFANQEVVVPVVARLNDGAWKNLFRIAGAELGEVKPLEMVLNTVDKIHRWGTFGWQALQSCNLLRDLTRVQQITLPDCRLTGKGGSCLRAVFAHGMSTVYESPKH